ncbi:MAG TPA: archaeal heat shock protein Hsp20 [Nitrososphaeraceae archaeon]
MSITPDDWFSRFWPFMRRGNTTGYFDDMMKGFDDMRREMQSEFEEAFKDIERTTPKDLIREYETAEGGKVREVGPIVYGYSMTIGPDGIPRIREFGNVKSSMRRGFKGRPMISSEREPLSDITTTDKEVRITIEMPGVAKEKIKISAYEDKVEVTSDDPKRKYHEVVQLPSEADIESVKSTYNNGILEITFKKKVPKSKGKEVKIE